MPVVRERDGVAYATSHDVAAFFEKQHKDVLKAIDALSAHGSNLSGEADQWFAANFAAVTAPHPTVAGRVDRSFNMTRDGFAVLAMGFTGPKALAFKLAYIAAFNLMEGQLRLATETKLREALETEAELRAALASRSGGKVMGFSAEARQVLGGMVKQANFKHDKRQAEAADKVANGLHAHIDLLAPASASPTRSICARRSTPGATR
jgi:Rha family phage regulatory protein